MENRRSIFLFYFSILLLAITALMHGMFDPPVTITDWISNMMFMGAVFFLIAMTLFYFRPRLRLMAQFQARAALLETVIKRANDGIIITEANLSKPGPKVIYVNDAFTQISGYSANAKRSMP